MQTSAHPLESPPALWMGRLIAPELSRMQREGKYVGHNGNGWPKEHEMTRYLVKEKGTKATGIRIT